MDERPYVAKVASWALRQIGKRSRVLNRAATACAQEIGALNNKTVRRVSADALRELQSPAVQTRLTK